MGFRLLAVMLLAAAGIAADTPFPDGVFGVWSPKPGVTPQAILGPLAYTMLNWPDEGPTSKGGFSALRDPKTGDVWFTLLVGQVFRVSGEEMQYCFGELGTLVEQSPFSVDAVGPENVTFCWRRGLRGMPTHTAGCAGCDCAKIEIVLTAPDELEFTFWMSPPVVHAHLQLVRKKKMPSMTVIESTMFSPYKKCQMVPHYGPNLPGEPDLSNNTAQAWPQAAGFEVALEAANAKKHYDDPKVAALAALPRGCARGLLRMAEENVNISKLLKERIAEIEQAKAGDDDVAAPALGKRKCHKLNGFNHLLNEVQLPAHRMKIPDVRLQYIKPAGACTPCDVSYSISAAVDEDEYISVGFKGQSWEHMFPYPPEYGRPCYFGMCVDSYDNFTSDRIALGYASSSHGTCVREVEVKDKLIGQPTDVEYPLLRGMSVERAAGRTIVRFTASQYWPAYKASIMPDGPFRTMWAIGKVTGGNGCEADIGYHGVSKGVSPVDWLLILGSTPCTFSDTELPSGPAPPAPMPVGSYACIGGQCTPTAGGLPIEVCSQACGDPYACLGGKCVEDPSGIPKQMCIANCGV